MWLLENLDDEVWGGRRLWLRPGKRYLFGRTASKDDEDLILIEDKTISRKHLTITVDAVEQGSGGDANYRSTITLEDLGTKVGTTINGTKIKGSSHVLAEEEAEIKMGHFVKLFRLFWKPVVFSFSFTSSQLKANAVEQIRDVLEPLDINYLVTYDLTHTTHVVSKTRNTSKGLQALINGRYIVEEAYVTAIQEVAAPEDGELKSKLEDDFESNWPNPADYLPPRGSDVSTVPVDKYAPDPRRAEIFDGYTFVFYEQKQFNNLFPVITNGKGKVLLKDITPGESTISELIEYVKTVAGEKGLGELEDGSEGKGVVVIKHVPLEGKPHHEWYANFANEVALGLNLRLVDQKEFMDIILRIEPERLRRPLEFESSMPEASQERPRRTASSAMDIDTEQSAARPAARTRRARTARTGASRFKGFDADIDDEAIANLAAQTEANAAAAAAKSQAPATQRKTSQLKRTATGSIMDEIAPNAIAAKRRRIEAGEEPVPRAPSPEPEEPEDEPEPAPKSKAAKAKAASRKKKEDIGDAAVDLARQRREEAEKAAAAEDDAGAGPDEIDMAELRALTLVETVPIRQPPAPRTREQDIAEGRWDPRWNGRQSFKKFQRRDQAQGRAAPKILIGMKATAMKKYGLSDDYWLENSQRPREREDVSMSASVQVVDASMEDGSGRRRGRAPFSRNVVVSDSSENEVEEEDEEMEIEEELPRSKAAKSAQKANSQRNSQRRATQSTQPTQSSVSNSLRGKRAAAAPPAKAPPAKKTRTQVADSEDESDDGLKFKFGRKR